MLRRKVIAMNSNSNTTAVTHAAPQDGTGTVTKPARGNHRGGGLHFSGGVDLTVAELNQAVATAMSDAQKAVQELKKLLPAWFLANNVSARGIRPDTGPYSNAMANLQTTHATDLGHMVT